MEKNNMAENNLATVPFVVYESAMEKGDRQQKRLVVVILVLIALLFASNAVWLYSWLQYDYVDEYEFTAEQDGEGVNIIGGGDISYGADGNSTQETEQGA